MRRREHGPVLGLTSTPRSMRPVAAAVIFAFLSLAPAPTGLAAQASPRQTVVRLYRAFAWEAVLDPAEDPTPGFVDQPLVVLTSYLTGDLARLIVADRLCSRRSHDVCALDFEPLWDSQDVSASDMTIAPSQTDSTLVEVHYRAAGGTDGTQISYRLVHTTKGWRIADILYSNGHSLRAMLSPR